MADAGADSSMADERASVSRWRADRGVRLCFVSVEFG